MSFKENLKTKSSSTEFFRVSSPQQERLRKAVVDKELTKELLSMTDFEYKKVRDLHLTYVLWRARIMEVAVLDNELPIYQHHGRRRHHAQKPLLAANVQHQKMSEKS